MGDFGATLEVVLRRRANQSTGLTIGKINEVSAPPSPPPRPREPTFVHVAVRCMLLLCAPQLLDQLYTAADADAKQQVLQVIVKQCSAREQKWITRIVLKDLKIGLKHERMLKYYHPDAMEACVYCPTRATRAAPPLSLSPCVVAVGGTDGECDQCVPGFRYNANTNLEAVCADPNLRDPRVRSKQQMKVRALRGVGLVTRL